MVWGLFSKEKFPDTRFHNQSSHPQIAFQEDNTVATLVNHGEGSGAL